MKIINTTIFAAKRLPLQLPPLGQEEEETPPPPDWNEIAPVVRPGTPEARQSSPPLPFTPPSKKEATLPEGGSDAGSEGVPKKRKRKDKGDEPKEKKKKKKKTPKAAAAARKGATAKKNAANKENIPPA